MSLLQDKIIKKMKEDCQQIQHIYIYILFLKKNYMVKHKILEEKTKNTHFPYKCLQNSQNFKYSYTFNQENIRKNHNISL